MSKEIWKNLIRYILLSLTQVILISQIPLPGNLQLLVYPFVILWLPFSISKNLLLIIGFLLGLQVDLMLGYIGLNATATTAMAFARIMYLKYNQDYENIEGTPDFSNMGKGALIKYALILLGIHHIIYFSVDIWNIHEFFYILFLTAGSLLLNLLVFLLLNLLFKPRKKHV